MKRRSVLATAIAIFGAVWALAVIAYTAIRELDWACWGGISYTLIAIGIAELYLLVLRKDPGEQAPEAGALGTVLTIPYLMIVMLLNSIFILVEYADFNWAITLLNVIVTAGYIVMLLWVDRSAAQVKKTLEKTERKTTPNTNISRKLGELLSITEDETVRARLLKLKEAVDYSNNISTASTLEREIEMGKQLDEIAQLTIGRADPMIVLNKLETAEMTWKMRNATSATFR